MRGLLKFLSVAIVVAGLYYARHYIQFYQVQKSSEFFVTDAVNTIGEKWDIKDFEKVADATLKSGGTIAKAFDSYRKLGPLIKPATCALGDYTSYKYQGVAANYISATYQCSAQFKNGSATLNVAIIRFQETAVWKILSFDVFSPFFTPAEKGKH